MKRWLLLACLAATAFDFGGLPAVARDRPTCDQLWYNRTAIYARRGMCFKDERALRVFGQRCFSPYGKLTYRDQRRVDTIARQQRRQGCNVEQAQP